jgi:hypothetical protein
MTMIRRVVVSILFSHYRTVSLQRSVHSAYSQPIPSATKADDSTTLASRMKGSDREITS